MFHKAVGKQFPASRASNQPDLLSKELLIIIPELGEGLGGLDFISRLCNIIIIIIESQPPRSPASLTYLSEVEEGVLNDQRVGAGL